MTDPVARQLVFHLPARPALGRDAFFVSPANALAVRAVDGWRDWPLGKLVLIGPDGAGKTHLAHVWAAEAGARIVAAADLAAQDIAALAAAGRIAVEDVPRLAGDAPGQEALLHLHNLLAEQGGRLLMTGAGAPRGWGLALADLASRIEGAPLATLAALDDELLSAVLAKLFADRQVQVAPAVIAYLVRRMERSLAAARRLVAEIDARALAGRRPVTLALAAEVLDGAAGRAP
jgi:chromosomal replication initiation ATPase DnaA